MKRLGEPDEPAELVVFLASNKSNYITKEVFNISGNFLIHLYI